MPSHVSKGTKRKLKQIFDVDMNSTVKISGASKRQSNSESSSAVDFARKLDNMESDSFSNTGSDSDVYRDVGSLLKEARCRLGISLSDISSVTKIREEYLNMVEEGRYEDVQGATYYYGCVRVMSRMANLPEDKVLSFLLKRNKEFVSLMQIVTAEGVDCKKRDVVSKSGFISRYNMKALANHGVAAAAVLAILLLITSFMRKDTDREIGDRFLQDTVGIADNL